jgi:hypothetical protein
MRDRRRSHRLFGGIIDRRFACRTEALMVLAFAGGFVDANSIVALAFCDHAILLRWQSDSADSLEQTRSVFELARTTQRLSLRALQGAARPSDYS